MLEDDRLKELIKQSRAADKEDKGRADLFQSLIVSPGWKAYIELLDKRQQLMADELMRPALSVDGAIRQEYVKGALSGLIIARDLPSVTIAAVKELREPEETSDAS